MVRTVFTLFMALFFFSCEQLIEVEDISNETVTILAPTNDATLETTSVSFSWQPIDLADSYQLQIALPSFDIAQIIVEDTIVSSASFIKTLEAANYQWRVKALNSAYETTYTTQSLTIED